MERLWIDDKMYYCNRVAVVAIVFDSFPYDLNVDNLIVVFDLIPVRVVLRCPIVVFSILTTPTPPQSQ